MKYQVSPLSLITTLFLGMISFTCIQSQQLHLSIDDERACMLDGLDSILCYQIAEKSFEGTFKRSNYIHPLFALDGASITEDFPEDHLHHRGIFWTWHQLYIGEKRIGDPWEIKDFCWEVLAVKEVESSMGSKAFKAFVDWKSPLWKDSNGQEKPVVREETLITVAAVHEGVRIIDIEISLLAMEKNMRIGGSEDPKGYGGFSPRIKLVEDTKFSNATGDVQPTNLPVRSSPWMDITGSIGRNKNKVGLTIISHPDNPGYPNPWILRSKRSMQNAVYPHPGAEAVALSHISPTVLKYRLVVHDGELKASDIQKEFLFTSG